MDTKHLVSQERNHDGDYEESNSTSSHLKKKEKAYESAKKIEVISKAIGYFGILLGVLSLFYFPYVLGGIGILLGFISMKMGEITLSSWAIGICAISIILSFFVVPIIM